MINIFTHIEKPHFPYDFWRIMSRSAARRYRFGDTHSTGF